ncbi:unnamed protein product [Acanthoscelides obtectus]|uniref:Uncharacterized protein n=1 Tax=Acanthoscelides obtectus TaxID=200917 RepID=A0A9P0Q2D8_ACAOB|nr:unnamed protein product [Acanthoscelides obtectus]CAK1637656.1 Uncharacterized protein CG3556 [Acanthoscelides obtectus]
MMYLPLIVGFSLVAFGYSQDLQIQQSATTNAYKATTDSDQSSSSWSGTLTAAAGSNGVPAYPTTSHAPSAPTTVSAEPAYRRALRWLVTQREADWGWRNDTAKAVTALQLAMGVRGDDAEGALMRDPLELQLSFKQMEVEIVVLLWRHHEIPIQPVQLAAYCLALLSGCQDPRQFHGHDLVGALQHREPSHDLDFAHAQLAACSARAHVRKKQIRRLLDIANTAKDHNIDTVAMTILALRCIVKDHRHRNLQHSLRRPSISLAKQQQSDGGFGNIYNTALTLQALQDLSDINNHWNRTAARMYIESRQDPDGAFTDPNLTAEVVLALSERGLGHIRNLDCGKRDNDLDNHVEIDGLTKSLSSHGNDSEIRNVTVTYTLWVGSNITENSTISITAPRNTSFYNIMQMAMEMDPRFVFEASEWPNGHYVHTLAGYKEEPMGYHYWLLYRLPEIPDPMSPPANQLVAPVGVDDLLIEEGDHYLFWYKKL